MLLVLDLKKRVLLTIQAKKNQAKMTKVIIEVMKKKVIIVEVEDMNMTTTHQITMVKKMHHCTIFKNQESFTIKIKQNELK